MTEPESIIETPTEPEKVEPVEVEPVEVEPEPERSLVVVNVRLWTPHHTE